MPNIDRNDGWRETTTHHNPKIIGNIYGDFIRGGYGGTVYDVNEISPTIKTASGGGMQPHIVVWTE